jgi:hypothetical protein
MNGLYPIRRKRPELLACTENFDPLVITINYVLDELEASSLPANRKLSAHNHILVVDAALFRNHPIVRVLLHQ